MEKNGTSKAAWANAKADSLLAQARDLEGDTSGDWRARSRRRRGAMRLRQVAGRYQRTASRLAPPDLPEDLPF